MADYLTGNFPQGGYTATHKGDKDLSSPWTPSFEISEGIRFGLFFPASYLPTVRFESTFNDYIVISKGKPVALDSNGGLVPAGFRKLLALGVGNGPQYTADDIAQGILNAQGNVPSVGDYVINSMIAASVTVGRILGVTSYNVYQLSGSDPTNPATYRFHNYNRQTGIAVLTDMLLEFPVEPEQRIRHTIEETLIGDAGTFDLAHATVLDYTIEVYINGARNVEWTFGDGTGGGGVDQLDWSAISATYLKTGDIVKVLYKYVNTGVFAAPFAGIASWRGSAKPGDFVTIDEDSNFVSYTPATIGDTSLADESAAILAAIDESLDIIGQVTLVDANFPKQFLDRVKTAYDDRLTGPIVDAKTGLVNELDRMPGSATDGMPHNIYFAGGDQTTGIVRFNMNIV